MHKVFFLALWIVCAWGLRIEDAEEGDCPTAGYPPVLDNDWSYVNNLVYISAASRHYLYAMASSHPRFRQMGDYDLRDNMCLTHNVTLPPGRGSAIGFGGRALGSYHFGPKRNRHGVFDLSFVPSNGVGGILKPGNETLTLTDYKTFAFFANCFTANNESKQKSWILLTLTPTISGSMRRKIENHALSLGFNWKNFLFLNYDRCGVDVGQNDRVSARNRGANWKQTGRRIGWAAKDIGSGQPGWKK